MPGQAESIICEVMASTAISRGGALAAEHNRMVHAGGWRAYRY